VETDNLLLEPEEIMRLGKFLEKSWERDYLENLALEKRLQGLTPEDRLQGLTAEERLQGLAVEERVQGLTLDERLQGLTAEQIEAYLNKIKPTLH